MCGRFVNTYTAQEIAEHFDAVDLTNDAVRPDYNISPTRSCAIVANQSTDQIRIKREVFVAQWGLVPVWAKDTSIGVRMFNARSETVSTKTAYRSAFAKRRCIVPASGYYEWQKLDSGKQPWYIHEKNEGMIGIAGIWEQWRDGKQSDWLSTFSILTAEANTKMQEIHDRVPVVLPSDLYDDWLDVETPKEELLRDAVANNMASNFLMHKVGREVGNVRNNSPELVRSGYFTRTKAVLKENPVNQRDLLTHRPEE